MTSLTKINYCTDPTGKASFEAQCFPLYSVLMALGNPTIDYFVVDIEGAEFPVLRTLPFEKLDIRLLQVELPHLGKYFPGTYDDLVEFFYKKGCVEHTINFAKSSKRALHSFF